MANKWCELYYGQSGTAKSESIAAVIRRIFLETGKTARVCVGDGSAATYAALVDAGIVELADYTIRDWPLSTLDAFCKGYWPQDAEDPNAKMVPLTKEKADSIGVYAIEGLSVASLYVMGDKKGGFAEQAARGIKIGQDSPIMLEDAMRDAAGNYIKGSGPGTKFGGNPLSHYGAAQKRILGFIEQSKALPGTFLIWTAHERSAEDKVSNQKMIGPEVAGGALTASISRAFNNTLHFATAEKTVKEKDLHTEKNVDVIDAEYRIYVKDHFRPEGNVFVKFKAVCRHPDPNGNLYPGPEPVKPGQSNPLALPTYFTSEIPGKSILDIYQHIADARARAQAAMKRPVAA